MIIKYAKPKMSWAENFNFVKADNCAEVKWSWSLILFVYFQGLEITFFCVRWQKEYNVGSGKS